MSGKNRKTYGEGTASGLMDVIHGYKGFVIYEDDEEENANETGTLKMNPGAKK